jgi:sugar phosphate isomerase/epimerase
MKIAIQENLIPGETLTEKFDVAEELGVEGVEVQGRSRLYDRVEEYEMALAGRSLKISTICGQHLFDWLDPDPAKRRASISETKRNLDACGQFKAVGAIVPPIFGPPRIPDLSPWMDAVALEKELLVEIVKDVAAHAHAVGTLLLLEPLNRYEQHLLRQQADGVEIIQRAGDPPGVAIISDFFHMHIEETNTPATIRQVAPYIAHVHLADNTRLQPGTGDINWSAGLQALKEIGYSGYLAFECRLTDDPKAALAQSVRFIRETIAALE